MASEIPIKRKDLWDSRGNIHFRDWIKAIGKLGVPLSAPNSGSSHHAIRKLGTDLNGTLGLDSFVVNIYPGMTKQVNGDVFREIRKLGFSEDDIWKALGKL
ncbi:MAG: hypothetical protein KGH56_01690 [Patescibacteria group bacterium]|nr:hypothetical protein [Patescibacteria group bacterium]